MPKQKTHKGYRKRVKISANGKVRRAKSGRRHLCSHKTAKQKRRLREVGEITGLRAKNIKIAVPR